MTPPKKKKTVSYDQLVTDLAVSEEEIQTLVDGNWPAWGTGSVVVDLLTEIGGLPKGRIVEVFGKPGVGKSNLLYSTAAQIQKEGKLVILLDFEGGFNPRWAQTLGMDLGKDKFLQVKRSKIRTLEDGFDVVYQILDGPLAERTGMIIWDSLAGATPAAIADKDSVSDSARLMSKASVLSEELPKLADKLEANGHSTTVGFVNQVRVNAGAMGFGNDLTTPGGWAFEHTASLRIHVKHRGFETKTLKDEFTGDKNVDKYAQRLTMIIEKTRFGQRGRKAETVFTYKRGIDNVWSLIELAQKREDFKSVSKQKYEVPAHLNATGKAFEGTDAKIKEHFYHNPESFEVLKNYMVEAIQKDYDEKVASYSFGEPDPPQGGGELDLSDGEL